MVEPSQSLLSPLRLGQRCGFCLPEDRRLYNTVRYSQPAKIRFNRVLRVIEVEAVDLETVAEQKLAIGPFSKHNGLMMDEFEADLN